MNRELDVKVAEKIYGFRWEKTPPDANGEYGNEDILVPPWINHKTWNYPPKGRISYDFFIPNYSSDLNKAWEIWNLMLTDFPSKKIPAVDFVNALIDGDYIETTEDLVYLFKKISPESICKAALIAVGNK